MPRSALEVPLWRAALQFAHSATPSWLQDQAFVLVKFHVLDDCPVQTKASCPFRVSTISWFCIISKLANDALNCCIQTIDRCTEQDRPCSWTQRSSTGDQSATRCSPVCQDSSVFHPGHCEENKKHQFIKRSKESEWNKMPSLNWLSVEERCVNNQNTWRQIKIAWNKFKTKRGNPLIEYFST